MSIPPAITLYGYNSSPFYQKVVLLLTFYQLPYAIVRVAPILPRPELSLLGVTYRRIPVLAIDGDIYVDTFLAAIALERIAGKKHVTGGIVRGSTFHWSDRAIFKLVVGFLPKAAWTDEFKADRSSFSGALINPDKIQQAQPMILSSFRSHLELIEDQLRLRSSKTHFLLDTAEPTYIDVSHYFTLSWCSKFPTTKSIFAPVTSSPFPLLLEWMSLMLAAIATAKTTAPKPVYLDAPAAAARIHAATATDVARYHDAQEPLLKSTGLGGWLALNEVVDITPDDTGRIPQRGTLVALGRERAVIDVVSQGGQVRVHFPRLGFVIAPAKKEKL